LQDVHGSTVRDAHTVTVTESDRLTDKLASSVTNDFATPVTEPSIAPSDSPTVSEESAPHQQRDHSPPEGVHLSHRIALREELQCHDFQWCSTTSNGARCRVALLHCMPSLSTYSALRIIVF
jgi:hypothetical protein